MPQTVSNNDIALGNPVMPPRYAFIFFSIACSAPSYGLADLRLGLPPVVSSADNPQTASKIDLGQRLFFDKNLSADRKIGCASCHNPKKAFSDGRQFPVGLNNSSGTRNTPALANVAFASSLFWDGRSSLERLATKPLLNKFEHGLDSEQSLLDIVRRDRTYQKKMKRAFGVDSPDIKVLHVSAALASYQRSLLYGDSAFDRYEYAKDPRAMDASAIRGLELFRSRARCAECHTIGSQSSLFTDHGFHGLAVGMDDGLRNKLSELVRDTYSRKIADEDIFVDPERAALGKFLVSKDPKDIGKFRTPSLRNVALTAPYMHDGSVASLEEAVDIEIYYRNLSGERAIILSAPEKADLVQFLRSLTSSHFVLGESK